MKIYHDNDSSESHYQYHPQPQSQAEPQPQPYEPNSLESHEYRKPSTTRNKPTYDHGHQPSTFNRSPLSSTERPSVLNDKVYPDKSFYDNVKIRDQDNNKSGSSGSAESVEYSRERKLMQKDNYKSDSTNRYHPKKRGPVLSFVKTNKGKINWGVRYPAN